MDTQLKRLILILGMSVLLSCSQSSEELSGSFSIGQSTKKSPTPSKQAEVVKADNGKASDDDEGIPGYMASIDNIETTIDQDKFVISAPEFTVSRMIERDIYAVAWAIDKDALDKDNGVILSGLSPTATFLGASLIAQNGSFYFVLSEPEETKRIVINISADPTPTNMYFTVDDTSTFAGLYVYKKSGSNSNDPNRRNDNRFQHNGNKNNGHEDPTFSLQAVGLKASDPSLLP